MKILSTLLLSMALSTLCIAGEYEYNVYLNQTGSGGSYNREQFHIYVGRGTNPALKFNTFLNKDDVWDVSQWTWKLKYSKRDVDPYKAEVSGTSSSNGVTFNPTTNSFVMVANNWYAVLYGTNGTTNISIKGAITIDDGSESWSGVRVYSATSNYLEYTDFLSTSKVDVTTFNSSGLVWQAGIDFAQATAGTNSTRLLSLEGRTSTWNQAAVDATSWTNFYVVTWPQHILDWQSSNAIYQAYYNLLSTQKVSVTDWQNSNAVYQGYYSILSTGKVDVSTFNSSGLVWQASISANSATGAAHTSQIGALTTTSSVHSASIAELVATSGIHTAQISALTTTSSTHTASISANTSTGATHTAQIAVLQTGKVDVATFNSSGSVWRAGITLAQNSADSNTATVAILSTGKVDKAGDTIGPMISTEDYLATSPAAREIPTAEWVRSLAMQGSQWYFTSSVTNGFGEKTANFVALTLDIPEAAFTNSIASPVTSDTYLVGGVTTSLYNNLNSPITFEVYAARVGGNVTTVIPAHPEVYYVYNGTTNHLGDWEVANQNIGASTSPTKYTWTVAFTEPSITGSVRVVGYLKTGTVSGTAAGLNIIGGDGYASHMDIDGVRTDLAQTHNTLPDLQGGTTDEYYHLTESQHTAATNLGTMASQDAADYTQVSDWQNSNGVFQAHYNLLSTQKVNVADWHTSNTVYQGYYDLLSTQKVNVADLGTLAYSNSLSATDVGAVPTNRTLTFNGTVWTMNSNGTFSASGGASFLSGERVIDNSDWNWITADGETANNALVVSGYDYGDGSVTQAGYRVWSAFTSSSTQQDKYFTAKYSPNPMASVCTQMVVRLISTSNATATCKMDVYITDGLTSYQLVTNGVSGTANTFQSYTLTQAMLGTFATNSTMTDATIRATIYSKDSNYISLPEVTCFWE